MRDFSAPLQTPAISPAEEGARATDSFIRHRLPQWIQQASPEQLAELRRLFAGHKATQQQIAAATKTIVPLHPFAEASFTQALGLHLGAGQSLARLEWRDKVRSLEGVSVPRVEEAYTTTPGLLRLMQNFAEGATPLDGSGLYAPGTHTLLSGSIDALVAACRALDAGSRYQALLDSNFTRHQALLMADKLAALKLALHVALLQKHIDLPVKAALEACFDGSATQPAGSAGAITAYPGVMSMLGETVHEALYIQLRGQDDSDQGVVVYLAGDGEQTLHRYASRPALEQALASQLAEPGYRERFCQRVALRQRGAFVATLVLRLADALPDLEVEGEAGHGTLCERWVKVQIERVKDDARLLLVPTADADARASRERLQGWASAGWSLANLAGFFLPAVGATLLANLMRQVCSQVYEGVADWAAGHDHEALNHLLNVAEIAAGAAVTAGAVAGATALVRTGRSAFVDGLGPVNLQGGDARLWHDELSVYASAPGDGAVLGAHGLYTCDDRYWVRLGDQYYEVHQPQGGGTWRLRHPLRQEAYGPVIEYNAERFWHLRSEQPMGWNDAAKMLDRLWPQTRPLDAQRAQWVLQAACSDVDELRGILVENRALPANLRYTLRCFEADQRMEDFFATLAGGASDNPDSQLLHWCRQRVGLAEVDDENSLAAVLDQAAALRAELFQHLVRSAPATDRVAQVVLRDFTGLPVDYALELANTVSAEDRHHIEVLGRLPLRVSVQARALQQLARLNRAQQGLILRNAYSDESGELAFSLLPGLANWPLRQGLELHTSSDRLLSILNPQAPAEARLILRRRNGQFGLYDHRGMPLESNIGAADDFFAAIAALLTPEQRKRMQLDAMQPAHALRSLIVDTIPRKRKDLLHRLGWREQQGWLNPGQRLADGRVGYTLGGRHSTERSYRGQLRARLASLYQGDSEAEIDEHVHRLSAQDDPFAALIYEEGNFQLLNDRLAEWVSRARESEIAPRRLMAARLRQAWRRQLPHDRQHMHLNGRILDLSGFQVTSLPNLAAAIDFHYVTTLVMINTPLVMEPDAFFSCFGEVRRLNFSRNQLRHVPLGLRHLVNLQNLQLSYNRIRMSPEGAETLSALPHLTDLDLCENPLHQLTLRFIQLPQLRNLYLRRCRLGEWPQGLEHCGLLSIVDLRGNQLAEVPEPIMQLSYYLRMAFHVEGNALSARQQARLHAPPANVVHAATAESRQESARELWVTESAGQALGDRWDRLFAVPGRERLQQILRALRTTRDYESHRADLAVQVWGLLEAMDNDGDLAEQVVAIANEETTCADSIAERFSDMRLLAMIAEANRATDGEQAALLELGLGLFRLDRLQAFMRMDIATREHHGQLVDPIEVRLSYSVALATEMQLPGQPTSIRYGDVAYMTAGHLDAARAFVREAETVEAQAQFLCLQPFWSNWLEREHAQAFAQVNDKYAELGATLTEQAEPGGSAQDQASWDDLEHGRASERFQLALLLTREVLQNRAGAGSQSAPQT